jgi:uncharacterized protein YecE (DUF72 family)
MYYSHYDEAVLRALAVRLATSAHGGAPAWCMFDNTMSAAATGNAITLRDLVADLM